MEDIQQIISVPTITVLVYGAMILFRYAVNNKESLVRLIPVFAVLLGCAFGVAVFYITPELMTATNVFSAILIGGSSGLAATGTHQVFKQLQRTEEASKNPIIDDETIVSNQSDNATEAQENDMSDNTVSHKKPE